ncbi:MAG: CDP-glucose 4,6-dehydratase [Verrucomicrobiota bacterium]|nr:CDP-glucose 4,6-dehydratase [Limisphaera sp.]MDW8383075.1 CDP-glucose 4,6-dehydratase [Verrucomicrobiota bacterium]
MNAGALCFGGFYSGRRVLVTGHTGFKGAWLSLWLRRLGAEVHGFSLPPPTQPSFYELLPAGTFASETTGDLRNLAAMQSAMQRVQPEVVFHLAAQALVRRSYAEPLDTFLINAVGTAHLLEAVRQLERPCVTVVVTSDKCYENREWVFAYRENDPLGGHDVYSMSKAAAELVVQAWDRSFFQPDPRCGPLATVRAGNVIGGGDYAADRIVPDCVRALLAGRPIPVRRPGAVRPWQHVLECLSGYLWLAARLAGQPKDSPLCGPFNFGPDPSAQQSVRTLVETVLRHWPGRWEDVSDPKAPHEAGLLTLAIEKAAHLLGWRPVWGFDRAVEQTVAWYRRRHLEKHADMIAFSLEQIAGYEEDARRLGIAWAQRA